MIFKEEKLSDCLEESKVLFQEHYEEIAKYKDIPLDPDFDKYDLLEKSGILKFYTARTEDLKLVGYACYFVSPSLHYKSALMAIQDVLFISKDYRGRGLKLIEWCDEELKKIGVQVVCHHIKPSHNWGPALERKGYQIMDYIYAKRLDK